MLCALIALPASADSLKRNNLPITGVTIIGVEDGQLLYRAAAGDLKTPLVDVSDIVIDAIPQFAAGQAAFGQGQLRQAQRAFEDVWKETRIDWVRYFSGYYLAQVYDQRNQPVKAAEVYIQIAESKADLFFLAKPPVRSLGEATEAQRKRIGEQIVAAAKDLRGEHRRRMEAYLNAVVGEGGAELLPEETGADGKVVKGSAALARNAKIAIPASVWRMLDRRGEPKARWTAIELLSKGECQAALDDISPKLHTPGGLPEKLYIYARAMLGLAEAKNDQDMYRDAALAFMRIAVHFNKGASPHPLVYPAKLEVAYIHKKIGREDICQRILFGGEGGGGLHLVIDDKKQFPYYRARYYEIIGEDPPKD